jgi:oligopeptide transport system permease protein
MYYLKRILSMVPLMVLISFLAFILVRMAPGGPFDKERVPASPEVEKALKAKFHLDEPLWKQYGRYLWDLFHGDLGPSMTQRNHTVNDVIRQALPNSMLLGGCSFLFAIGIGIPLGFYSAVRKGHWIDWAGSFLAILAICVPALVIGPLLAMVFAIRLKWLPVGLLESPASLVLPTITLGIYFAGKIARLMREGMLDVLGSGFMTMARAKGLSDLQVNLRHGLRLGVLPVISYSGPLLADLLTGTFVVEYIFQIPGLGVFLVNSSLSRDYTMIVGLVVLYAGVLLALNLAVDFAYSVLDPRVRYD